MVESGFDTSDRTERLVEAMLAQVEATLATPLSDEEQAAVRVKIAQMLQHADAVMAYPLENADEPEPVFHPYRAEG